MFTVSAALSSGSALQHHGAGADIGVTHLRAVYPKGEDVEMGILRGGNGGGARDGGIGPRGIGDDGENRFVGHGSALLAGERDD